MLFKLLSPALLLLITGSASFSQQPDSTQTIRKTDTLLTHKDSVRLRRDSTYVAYFNNDFEKFGRLNVHANDTAITGFQNYDPLYDSDRFYATLGNIGLNYRYLLPFQSYQSSGFDYGIHSFDKYLYQNDSVKYYKVYKTYTELTYTQGAKKEQMFHAIFSRNLYRSLNLGFDLKVLSSPGAYTRQKTNHINFVLTTQFFTKNKRYGVIANFTVNRLKNYENGGIKYDSLFEQNIEPNRQVIPVNLASAQNRIKESGFFMKHYFDLTRHTVAERDTSLPEKRRLELGRLSYSFQYNRQIQNYLDALPDSGFYPPPLLDTVATYDSLTIKKFINDVTWSNPSYNPQKKLRILRIEAGLRQQYIEVSLHDVKRHFIQYIPHGEIDFNPIPSIRLQGKADFVLGDYNEGDFSFHAELNTILGTRKRNAGIITLRADLANQQPGWFFEHYLGNNFRWDTTWNKQGKISGGFDYAFRFLKTGFTISRINNYVFLDSAAMPSQFTGEFGHIMLYLNADLDVWRFKFKAKAAYQTIQGTSAVRVPAFIGDLTVYFTQPLFKGAATLQPGLSFFYNSAYYADGYLPATRSFYLQDGKEIGNYLYMDVFINLKIQRARFFVMYSHFNAGWMGRTYYTTPSYPMQDGAFKFGITWRFHD